MYEQTARYYDLVHAELKEDIPLVLSLAGQGKGPILELGCGTGRLLLPLARAGYPVIGLDNSPAMLEKARNRLTAESKAVRDCVTLIEGDMTEFELKEQVGFAIIPYNTLLHLKPAAMQQTFKTINRHLAENGRLFIDVVNPMLAAQTPNDHMLTLERVMTDPETGETVVQMAASWVNLQQQVLHITWLFDANPPDGGAIHRTVVEADYHYIYLHELELMLQTARLRVVKAYGDYERRPFDEESDRLLLLATKSRQ
ncbi:MAG: class I SAM-dependent methyltransferase [Candidatus Promineifilaceae bacterium]